MPRRPLSKLTPQEAEERRVYMRKKKAESRDRMREAGLCYAKTAECTGNAKPGGTTCHACDDYYYEQARQRAAKDGWNTAPSKKIPRTIRKLRRQGLNVADIVKDPYLMEYGVERKEVSEVLRESGLL